MVRFARHGTNEVCGVECKSAVFYGTELSNPQSSSIGEMYRGNILEGISLPQAILADQSIYNIEALVNLATSFRVIRAAVTR